MCGIAGLFCKTAAAQERLGAQLGEMLTVLADRGPDSVGVALYRDPAPAGRAKLSLLVPAAHRAALEATLASAGARTLRAAGDCLLVDAPDAGDALRAQVREMHPDVVLLAAGAWIETVKCLGRPAALIAAADLGHASGTHALGHTRMATESRVTTAGAHPFSTGADLCLVHNGSLSNHNRLRTRLRRAGIDFATENDSEVAAGYLEWRLREGDDLAGALERALVDLDGFFTFAVGSADGFAVLRDPIACKPAVLAETEDWVAMASEYRAIAVLPGSEDAEVWEPAPGRVYSWSHALAGVTA